MTHEPAIAQRLQAIAGALGGVVEHHAPMELEGDALGSIDARSTPLFVILDIEHDLNWGKRALQAMRRARLRVPILVLSDDFSKAFGRKIVSEGVQYHLSRDFSSEEARALLGSFFASDKASS